MGSLEYIVKRYGGNLKDALIEIGLDVGPNDRIRMFASALSMYFNNKAFINILSKEIAIANDELDYLNNNSNVDSLTEIPLRESMEKHFDRAYEEFSRKNIPFAVGIADADHFKKVNDKYGHLVGDDVLKELVVRIKSHIRKTDGVYRYGGEEFGLVYSGVNESTALILPNKLKEMVVADKFKPRDGHELGVSVSVGVYVVSKGDSFDDAMSRADKALYRAKEDGRNRVVLHGD